MPPWFWAACPHLENVCPVFLKNALHLHSPAIQQNSDDLLQQQNAPTAHPLDSQYTTDVLRLVFARIFVVIFTFQTFVAEFVAEFVDEICYRAIYVIDRYVLEGYNALSWLALDANTKDRLSCLPVHVQALMHLYHATAALV